MINKKMKVNKQVILFAIITVVIVGGIIFSQNNNNKTTALPTPTILPTIVMELTSQERQEILSAADTKVKANTVPGMKYSLSIKKYVGNYVRVDVTPGKEEQVDPAQVIMEKKDGIWEATNFGTSFPDLYQKVPALFE